LKQTLSFNDPKAEYAKYNDHSVGDKDSQLSATLPEKLAGINTFIYEIIWSKGHTHTILKETGFAIFTYDRIKKIIDH
jgi:hypothetical protein